MNAPIALFVFARPYHVRRTVEVLLQNPESSGSNIIIFRCSSNTGIKESGSLIREYIAGIQVFISLAVYHRPQNFGLAKSII